MPDLTTIAQRLREAGPRIHARPDEARDLALAEVDFLLDQWLEATRVPDVGLGE